MGNRGLVRVLKKQDFITFYRNHLHYGMDGLGLGTVGLALIVFGLGLDQLALASSVLALLT